MAANQNVTKKKKAVIGGIFKAELNNFLMKELAEDGYSGVEVRSTPAKAEVIIMATRTQNVLGEGGRRIRELTSVVQKRFGFEEGSVELYAEKVSNRGLCAVAQCESLRYKLVGGLAVRRACYGVLRFIMESGAQGVEVIVSGKLQFDDEGVQWGPTGNLDDWMDDKSKTGFQNMAKCVINEYNNFCPLNASLYTPNCVKGTQTQGENIADNGGVHAAFNAYKTHQALDGPDPRLPDRLFGQFTHDQLFFMSFAQVWCTVRPSDDDLYTSLMTDPHSPSMYRVAGTIQNFPAFQTAFNCPLGSASAPKDHCEVWVPKKYQ